MTGHHRAEPTGRRTAPSIEWPTVALIVTCYAAWLAAGLVLYPITPWAALVTLGLATALHSSLVHECLHGHPTRSSRLNELLVGLPLGLVYPYRRFKALHLQHHADERLTDPFEDPESYYRARWKHDAMPGWLQGLLRLNNTMLGRIVIGPWLATIGFALSEARLMRSGDAAVRRAWLHHAAGLAIILPIVVWGFGMPLWLYVLAPVWLGQAIIAVRTFAEHQWAERPDGRTIIVERSPLALFFLNNNLHLVHHKLPTVPWYRLPAIFRERRAEWVGMNGGYVYPNYLALLRAFAFRAKEPVVHPVLRQMPEPGRAFRPGVRQRNVSGLGSVPVPAEPPTE